MKHQCKYCGMNKPTERARVCHESACPTMRRIAETMIHGTDKEVLELRRTIKENR